VLSWLACNQKERVCQEISTGSRSRIKIWKLTTKVAGEPTPIRTKREEEGLINKTKGIKELVKEKENKKNEKKKRKHERIVKKTIICRIK